MRRISVIRNEKIVPLLPSRPVNSNLLSALSGIIVETHALGSIEIPEHEHSSFCFTLQTGRSVEIEWWSEGRNGKESHRSGSMVILTPGTRHRARFNNPRHSKPSRIRVGQHVRLAPSFPIWPASATSSARVSQTTAHSDLLSVPLYPWTGIQRKLHLGEGVRSVGPRMLQPLQLKDVSVR